MTQENVRPARRFELTAFDLKMIAIISMFIDHVGFVIVYDIAQGVSRLSPQIGARSAAWISVYWVMRYIGRLAFPIFCFFIAEGVRRTHSRPLYALRLALFAVISEVPFDLAFSQTFCDWTNNNVLFTLLFGMLAAWIIEALRTRLSKRRVWFWVLTILVAGGFYHLAQFAQTDYGGAGVITVILMYLILSQDHEAGPLAMLAGCLVILFVYGKVELPILLDVVLVAFYHGEKGRRAKYFFYVFYPAHLALLSLIAHFLRY